jgi:hypothetical protein
MKAKKICSAALLVFVALSLVELVVKRVRLSAEEQGAFGSLRDGVLVCYFHGKTRCDTCRAIEASAREAVEKGFQQELAGGSLHWRVINFDEPKDRHFDTDFKLGGIPAVVLVQLKDREPVRWKNLSDVWQLVMEKDKTPLSDYVQNEVRAFMKEEETESKKAESREKTSTPPTAGDVAPGESLPIP